MGKFIFFLLISTGLFAEDFESLIDQTIYYNQFGKYFVPLNHNRPAVNAIKNGSVYELETLNFIKKIYKKNTSIIHAGTYFGDMLPFFSKLAGSQKVWALEPIMINYVCAKKNIELNNINNVNLYNLALSNKKQQLVMETKNKNGTHNGGGSHIIDYTEESKGSSDRYEVVKSTTIDEMLLNNSSVIGLIHLDIEGHELMALKGARKTIETYHPTLIVEGWSKKLNEIDLFMKKIHYKKVKVIDGNYVYIPR